jgi:hypothetical protein
MKHSKVLSHGGISLDLSRIKSFHIDTWTPNKRSHILRIELNSRYEYIYHPGRDKYEKIHILDFIEHPYSDYSMAEAYRNEWQEYWEDYLNGRL